MLAGLIRHMYLTSEIEIIHNIILMILNEISREY